MKLLSQKQKGFSLLELMLVVAILGILATLAIPQFQNFQARARMGEGVSNLSALYTMQQAYAMDNGGMFLAIYGVALPTDPYGEPTDGSGEFGTGAGMAAQNCAANGIGFAIAGCDTAGGPRFGYYATSAAPATGFAITGTMGSNTVNTSGNCAAFNVQIDLANRTLANQSNPCP